MTRIPIASSRGVVLLKSRDLVNWKIAGHAVPDVRQISKEMDWDRMARYGNGVCRRTHAD